jgi:hypothetical protein
MSVVLSTYLHLLMAVPLKSEIWFFRSPIPDTWLDKLTSIEFDLILNPCKGKILTKENLVCNTKIPYIGTYGNDRFLLLDVFENRIKSMN